MPRLIALLAGAAWLAAAWLGRVPDPAAIPWTEAAFVTALALSALFALSFGARSPRRLLLRTATAALSLALTLLIAEIPALFGVVDYGRAWSVASGEWVGPAAGFVSDPVLGWSRPAHVRWSGRPRSDMAVAFNLPLRAREPQSFQTDAHGFRNRVDRARADVVLIGDSYVEGAYVSDADTVAEQLERLGGERVVNLGRSGYGTLQELEVLRLFALPLRPRAVRWFFFEGNDLYDDETFENALAYLRRNGSYQAARRPWLDPAAFREASLSVTAYRLLRRSFDPLVPVGLDSYGWFRDATGQRLALLFYRDAALRFEAYEEARFARTEDAFRRGAALCREHGVACELVFVPSKFRVYGDVCELPPGSPCRDWRPWQLESRFAAFCARERLPLLDLTGPMRAAAARGELLYAPEDSHWNAAGHRFVAALLAAGPPRP